MWERFSRSIYDRLDIIVLTVSLIVSFGVWQYLVKNDSLQNRQLIEYENKIKLNLNNLTENMFIYVTGVKGLYESSEIVSDVELSSYVSTVSENKWTKNLLTVRYVDRVRNEDFEKYEREKVSEHPNFKPKVDLNYPEQFIVSQVVDSKGKVFESTGHNLVSDEKRRLAIDESIDLKSPVMTSVDSVVDVEGYTGSGLIFIVPVLKNNEVVGLINALVKLDEVVLELKSKMDPDGYLLSWEGDGKIFESDSVDKKQLTKEIRLEILNSAEWKIVIGVPKKVNNNVNLVLGLGVVISFLLYVMVYALASAGVRGMKIAEQLTSKLFRYKLALDSANSHIVITDSNGVVVYANNAASELTGYSKEEIIGKTPRLWGGQMPKDFYMEFWKKIKVDKQVFSGDFNNRRKNGESYIAQSTVSPIIDEKGELVGFVGVEEDVTEERRLYKQNMESMDKLNKFNQLMVGRELKMMELKKELSEIKNKDEK